MLFVTAGSVRVRNSETEQSRVIEQGQAHVTYLALPDNRRQHLKPAKVGW